ncbi:type III PLP-dependent enzyme [Actinokineospora diospyrosa]|uniref:ornithine decarboxylase n=1 Tax=Actinokineospora diospyrosa TaxID=103728 RepID=A0ABT1IBR5_9PSEU|nr:type III PLP-dependent enzyme [Actinokineospora diospyrosa]MCP2270085.1 ornithine decarboxylase [Actinokineospora diospyrosa]
MSGTDLMAALAAASTDRVLFDLDGIRATYRNLTDELPGVEVKFAMKACPVDEVIAGLAARGAGVDAASPGEIAQALSAGVAVSDVHFGNTVKSDQDIVAAYRLGVRDFATDSLEDVTAIARHAPGSRVFCRLATDGAGALWPLSRKCGCSVPDAVRVLDRARQLGLKPSGLSVHIGSQQMSTTAWRAAFDRLADAIVALRGRGIALDHVNLGGGLPALTYLDRRGEPLRPPLSGIFEAIRSGIGHLRGVSPVPLRFLVEPGRHLVADHGAIRAHVARLTSRQLLDGGQERWLYLSCGKFNGLYETDQLRYRLVFPASPAADFVPAMIAGPTCDSDDAFGGDGGPVRVPRDLRSGDPVWIMACGAYSISYMTRGFNGFGPLPYEIVQAHDREQAPCPA